MAITATSRTKVVKTSLLVCICDAKEALKMPVLSVMNRFVNGAILASIKQKDLSLKFQEKTVFHMPPACPARQLLLLGSGNPKDLTLDKIRHLAGTLAARARQMKASTVTVEWSPAILQRFAPEAFGQAVAEGLGLGQYRFEAYKTVEDAEIKPVVSSFSIIHVPARASGHMNTGLANGSVIADCVNMVRDLQNMPPNDLYPKTMVDYAKGVFSAFQNCIEIEVVDAPQAKALGMGAFLGVAQGSVREPYFLILRYQPVPEQKPLALIGKGVTFDSGGLDIKPAAGMEDMKADMTGAATILGVMRAVCHFRPSRNILALIPLVENMPSGSAQRPGDIVRAMNGKTIEITNTDAEGRLILADALCYAVQQQASKIVDIATLTGACSVALGDAAAAILGNNQKMVNTFIKLSGFTGERLWQLPLFDDYLAYLSSSVADIMNSSSKRLAGTATAAKFLEQFVGKTPWVHLDIANVDNCSIASGYQVKGFSGTNTRNLIAFVLSEH